MTPRREQNGTSTEDRNAKVRAVLLAATEPIGPTEIARRINELWCKADSYFLSSSIAPVLKRIGAVRHNGGEYTLAKEPA